MAVLHCCGTSAILDHEAWLTRVFRGHKPASTEEGSPTTLNYQVLFDLRTPFLMDDQAKKLARHMEAGSQATPEPPRKKKKKQNNTDDCWARREQEGNKPTSEHVQEVFMALRQTQQFRSIFQYTPDAADFESNNCHIRNVRRRFIDASEIALPVLSECHNKSSVQLREVNGSAYLVPPDVRYMCDDVARLKHNLLGKKFDLIVLDPPWRNKYIQRRTSAHGRHHGYSTMTVGEVLQLPVGELVQEGGLVAVWCTNNTSIIQHFTQGLHLWGLQLVATWYWLKVTKSGEAVTPFSQDGGKQPYEHIFFARRCKNDKQFGKIPDGLVFCSVPSGIHSHKPPLNDILMEYVAPEPRCLEIFARSLVPGWTSYGLEVLRLQHAFLFGEWTEVDTDER